jgi:hypothetical protein
MKRRLLLLARRLPVWTHAGLRRAIRLLDRFIAFREKRKADRHG